MAAGPTAQGERPDRLGADELKRGATMAAAWLAERLAGERDRWVLWIPVVLGVGAGIYFILPSEPPVWAGPTTIVLAAVLGVLGRSRSAWLVAAIGLVAFGLGLTLAQQRAIAVTAPVLERRWGPAELTGRVVTVEIRAEGRRVTFDHLSLPGVPTTGTPAQVRVRLRKATVELQPGDRVALRAILLPPPPPAAPGAYDFQRQAYFDRLGAVGYAVGQLRRLAPGDDQPPEWRLRLNAARQAMVERILALVPGPAGAVAAALMTGEMGSIPADAMAAMRDSGLAHLLSISGLHIGLVAGIVFVAVRRALALVPPLALRFAIKKWAAVWAFLAISFYTLFTAPSAPTQRSWLMTSIVLFAILVDRTAITMRLVAWAAFAIVVIFPESMLGPSFQMSFGAVVALIAGWEVMREPLARWRGGGGWLRRIALGLAGTGMTTLIAGFASAPYALYHFNRFAAYGLAANLIAVPLTGMWVMPCVVLCFLLWPFGLESWALIPMGWGNDIILAVAREVAGWTGAVALLPAMPAWGLVAITLGGLWLCLWRTRWRLAGMPIIAIGLASILLHREPDVLVSGDAKLIAVRGADGLMQMSSERAAPLTRDTWLRRAGQEEQVAWPKFGSSADGRLTCDAKGCIYTARGHVVALVRDVAALTEDCRLATVVVAIVPVRRACPSAIAVIDRFALWRDGGHAVWLDKDGAARVESVRAHRGERPWVPPLPTPRAARARSEG